MHVTKNKRGQFIVENAPMRLSGVAEKQFLADMATGASRNPKHEQVLAECRRQYEQNRAAKSK
jgi:hypothetical protein